MADRRDDERRFKGDWQDPETERRLERRGPRVDELERERLAGDSDELRRHGGHSDLLGLHDLDDLSDLQEHYREHRREHGGELERGGAPRPMGRGPKGYQRSDSRIREDICDRLMVSWMDAENVEVLVLAGEVTLQGTVKSRDEKRAIEAVAESVLGVKDIHNTLRVDSGEQASAGSRPEEQGDHPLHS
jgi:hypothetical protein